MDKITRRIRSLLDKAESTEFDAERDSFIAAATKLMRRYQVDMAEVGAADGSGTRGEVGYRHLHGLPRGPYVVARSALASVAAEAAGCRAWRCDTTLVFCGFEDQTAAAEVLYTSLLLQATRGAARDHRPELGNRTSYNRNYILGFAAQVLERIRADAAEPIGSHAGEGPGAALALAATDEAIDAFLAAEGVRLTSNPTRVTNAAGMAGGRLAGSRADLGSEPLRATPALPG